MNNFIKDADIGIEVGSGAGFSKEFINNKNFKLTDLGDDEHLDFKNIDAQNTGFENESFNYVIASNMIHHIPFPIKFFKEMNRILKRNGKLATVNMTLRNKSGSTKLVDKPSSKVLNVLGIELEELSQGFKVSNRIKGGVKIKKINKGKVEDETVVKEGFVITKIDDENIESIDDFKSIISSKEGGVMFEGFYPGKKGSYYF